MKKILLGFAICMAVGLLAQTKTYDGFTLTLNYNELTRKMDTSTLGRVKFNYTGSLENPSKVNYAYEQYNYRYGKFEQGMKADMFGNYYGGLDDGFYSDSSKFYFPAKDGSLNWLLYQKTYAIFNAKGQPMNSVYYNNFSYLNDFASNNIYGLFFPDSFLVTHQEYITYSGNVKKSRLGHAYTFIPAGMSFDYDSSYLYYDKNGKDSLYLLYNIDEFTNEVTLAKKVTQTSTGIDNYTILTTEYNYDGDSSISKEIFNDYNSSNFNITQFFEYDGSKWVLTELDSTFYEADSITGYSNIYGFDISNNWRLIRQEFTTTNFDFEQGNPVPIAPSNFSILALLGNNLKADLTSNTISYQLTWTDNSYNEDGFYIYRKEIGTDNTPILIDSTGKDVEIYIDENVSSLEVYEYFVIAYSGKSESSKVYTSSPVNARTDGAVDVKDQIVLQNSTIAPNPVIGNTINVVGTHESMNYSIMNLQGQEISTGTVVNGTIENNLQSGIYLLKLNKNDSIKVIKFEVK